MRKIDVNKIKEPIAELQAPEPRETLVYGPNKEVEYTGRVRKIREHEESPNEKWARLVKEGKLLTLARHQCRLRLCLLAEEACTIVHGGGGHWSNHEGIYTLKNFALEIGIAYKTIHSWVSIKKTVYEALDKPQQDNFFWGCGAHALLKVNTLSRENPTEEMPKDCIRDIYTNEVAIKNSPRRARVQKVESYVRTLRSNIPKLETITELEDVRKDLQAMLMQIDMVLVIKKRRR